MANGLSDFVFGKDYEYKYKAIGDQLGGVHGSAQASLQKALAAIKHGYGGAQNAISMGGSVATKALLDREKQGFAQNQQSMISRGLYDSTAFDAGQRGITSDTNNALAGLNAQLAQLGSNVKISQGQAEASAYTNMAQNDEQYNQLLLSLGLNTQYGKQGGHEALIGGIIGSLSDRRLKTNIDLIGVADGIQIYEFDYKDMAKMPGRYRGVMADELLKTHPKAVTKGPDGYLRVDYTQLGFDMRRIDIEGA